MITWSDAEDALTRAMPGYESRAPQRNLATAIEGALVGERHLFGQAGTGTGKSVAALVPAINRAKETGRPVAISTATKALQDQYSGKDLPFLQELYREQLGVDVTFAVLKGRGNYLCLSKVSELSPGDVFNQQGLLDEMQADPDLSGDLDELVTDLDMRDRSKLTSTSDECPGKSDCPFGESCFAVKAKAKAQLADIVVVNDSLLVMNAKLRADSRDGNGVPTISLLPELSGIVVDEAHELNEYATSALGNEFSERTLTTYATEALNYMKLVDPEAEASFGLHGRAKVLFEKLTGLLEKARQPSVTIGVREVLSLEEELMGTLESLRDSYMALTQTRVHGDDQLSMRRKRLVKRAHALAARFESVLLADDGDLVRWVESDVKRGTLLKFAPLHVGAFLKANIWDETPTVFLSATLALGSDFSFIAGQLGVDKYDSFDAGTPFDYPRQSRLFVPSGFLPSGDQLPNWRAKVTAVIPELVGAAGGRSLLLFTSTKAMNEAYDNTSGALKRMGLTVLKQGDRPNKMLAATFKSDPTSVLYALKSFMTGIDVQGDALRLVVLDKMPFPNPSDVVFAARSAAIDKFSRGFMQSSFMKLSVPMMALTLLQAAGRLIRTRDDEGMIAILDSRYAEKSYLREVRASMPPSKMINDLDQAVDYLKELTARRG
jgi:ATP-dependent DNA helicase DinG